jgi:hypothetical protein
VLHGSDAIGRWPSYCPGACFGCHRCSRERRAIEPGVTVCSPYLEWNTRPRRKGKIRNLTVTTATTGYMIGTSGTATDHFDGVVRWIPVGWNNPV